MEAFLVGKERDKQGVTYRSETALRRTHERWQSLDLDFLCHDETAAPLLSRRLAHDGYGVLGTGVAKTIQGGRPRRREGTACGVHVGGMSVLVFGRCVRADYDYRRGRGGPIWLGISAIL